MSFATVFSLLPASKNRDNEMDTPVDRWDDPQQGWTISSPLKPNINITHVQFLFSGRSLTLRIIIFFVILSGIRNACISTVECFVRVLVAQKLQLVFKNIVILNTCRFSSSPSSVALHSDRPSVFRDTLTSLSPQKFTAKLCTNPQEYCLVPPEQEELLQKLLTVRECETHSFF